MTFQAQYSGRCAGCDSRIRVGDQITMTDDGAVHASCKDADAVGPQVEERVCTTCWLTICDCNRPGVQ